MNARKNYKWRKAKEGKEDWELETKERRDQEVFVKKGAVKKSARNAKCFAKERLTEKEQTLAHTVVKLNSKWSIETKVKLFLTDKEEREKGRRFMKRKKKKGIVTTQSTIQLAYKSWEKILHNSRRN